MLWLNRMFIIRHCMLNLMDTSLHLPFYVIDLVTRHSLIIFVALILCHFTSIYLSPLGKLSFLRMTLILQWVIFIITSILLLIGLCLRLAPTPEDLILPGLQRIQ